MKEVTGTHKVSSAGSPAVEAGPLSDVSINVSNTLTPGADVNSILCRLRRGVRKQGATLATQAWMNAASGTHAMDVAQQNWELEARLTEKFVLLSLEGARTKEQFMTYMHHGRPGWRLSMTRSLMKKSLSLCKVVVKYHLFHTEKRQYQAVLDTVLQTFLAHELRCQGIAGVMNKMALLKAISDFDRLIVRN